MNAERFRRAGELYHLALNVRPEARRNLLAEHCGGDRELLEEVESLLAANAEASGFLSQPAKQVAAALLTGPGDSTVPEEPVAIGRLIGPYRVIGNIGAGGMGRVFLAEDTRLRRKAALKCLRAGIAASESGFARLEQEACAASALNHPNILTVYDLIESGGQQFLAAEYIEGETLRERMQRGRLSVSEITEIGAQIANALEAAHAAGIVHGDIKPANIMVRADGLVKVLDFGLARQSAPVKPIAANGESTPMGTLFYMSPEQLLRKPLSGQTDIFSLGVVLYQMATGKIPFRGDTDAAVWFSLLNETPAPLRQLRPDAPKGLERVVTRAIEKDPALRYRSAAELGAGLRAAADGPSKAQLVRRAGVVAALALTALGATAAWLTSPLPAPRVTRIAQITSDPGLKTYYVSDGASVYYSRGHEDATSEVLKVSLQGGEPTILPQFAGMFPLDISRDGKTLLLGKYRADTANGPFPLWLASAAGGAPARLGALEANFARWSPDGSRILYTHDSELRLGNSDGSASRVVAAAKGLVKRPVWSPDGRTIRFTVVTGSLLSLWEVRSDGSGLREVLPDWSSRGSRDGAWVGKRDYAFSSGGDIWMLPAEGRFRRPGNPARLTSGPYRVTTCVATPLPNRFLFTGVLNRGELVRYDRKADRWIPYLGGLAASQMSYSRDGHWMAWVAYPEGTVWRSRRDGSEQVQLTAAGIRAYLPQWSPDGRQVAFFGAAPGKPEHIYIVPSSGGQVRQLTHGEAGSGGELDESWSPDGRSLVFSPSSQDTASCHCLKVVDVATGTISTLPASDGLWSPRWSPDGRYIAALESLPVARLWLYDTQTHQRRALSATGVGWPNWSRDSRYVYFEDNAASAWYRVAVEDGRVERLAGLKDLILAPSTFGWVGLSPDGELISTRDKGSTEIYALDWERLEAR